MKITITADEMYPVYSFGKLPSHYGTEIEVSGRKVSGWKRAMRAFDKAQKEMKQMAQKARDKNESKTDHN